MFVLMYLFSFIHIIYTVSYIYIFLLVCPTVSDCLIWVLTICLVDRLAACIFSLCLYVLFLLISGALQAYQSKSSMGICLLSSHSFCFTLVLLICLFCFQLFFLSLPPPPPTPSSPFLVCHSFFAADTECVVLFCQFRIGICFDLYFDWKCMLCSWSSKLTTSWFVSFVLAVVLQRQENLSIILIMLPFFNLNFCNDWMTVCQRSTCNFNISSPCPQSFPRTCSVVAPCTKSLTFDKFGKLMWVLRFMPSLLEHWRGPLVAHLTWLLCSWS